MNRNILPAVYFLGLFMLEQYRFLEVQEACIFDAEEHAMKRCPLVAFKAPDGDGADDRQDMGHDCAICQVEVIGKAEYVYNLPCNHQFHRWCLIVWLIREGRSHCPLCRYQILINGVCRPGLRSSLGYGNGAMC
ncbi:uncharacterized protein A1O5_09362 [Cladophialophora psammophila CBS 110553]|uniref:RING-type domain-containing protein n=1 Tax=Cladophialophora psammophila CBS 110553 TaxID=1182543 RepID=W9XAA6_9EURO|nr:uncharacterized protein A1O5_09362 [Cladophialophora psammophila CBS 110553]EXJ67349.1 hypothetical protein A1O5_09362 [Cladophialophora psammophila CBS 110553]